MGIDEKLAGYTRVDLNTSYDITDNVQVYGLVKNLFNSKYGLYGTYFEADEVSPIDQAWEGPASTIRARSRLRCRSRLTAASRSNIDRIWEHHVCC